MERIFVDEGVYRDTLCGKIHGRKSENVEFFCGIPYARTKRFEMPVQICKWDGVLEATKGELDCWQYSSFRDESKDPENFYYKEFRSERQFEYTESPMTLNIICPQSGEGCPVIIFFHGGGHETGTVGELPYGTCTEYAKRGVILVSVGYRLNVFSLYRGKNYGLHDQITAIHWIRDNIAAFGGDPERIILMGQSAGAMSITDLCLSQKLKGVIKGAVMMSGGGAVPRLAGPWQQSKCKDFWDDMCRRTGASNETELKAVSPKTLWEAWYAQSQEKTNYHLRQPEIDGDIIPNTPQKILRRGDDLDIPLIFGVTSQDFLPVIMYEMALSWGVRNAKKGRAPVYGYMFRRTPPGGDYKAFHGVDLWYMFGNMDKSWRKFTKEDLKLSARMIDYISEFARTGDPNDSNLPKWPAISYKDRNFMCFDIGSPELLTPHQCRKLVWHTAVKDKGPL